MAIAINVPVVQRGIWSYCYLPNTLGKVTCHFCCRLSTGSFYILFLASITVNIYPPPSCWSSDGNNLLQSCLLNRIWDNIGLLLFVSLQNNMSCLKSKLHSSQHTFVFYGHFSFFSPNAINPGHGPHWHKPRLAHDMLWCMQQTCLSCKFVISNLRDFTTCCPSAIVLHVIFAFVWILFLI
jgi:hypothetical protein